MPVDQGCRVVQPVLFADLVEVLFVKKTIDQLPPGVGRDHIFRIAPQVIAAKPDIVIAASDEKNLFILLLFCKIADMAPKLFRMIILLADIKVDDVAVVAWAGAIFPPNRGPQPVLLMKSTRHGVNVYIAAEEQRGKLCRLPI